VTRGSRHERAAGLAAVLLLLVVAPGCGDKAPLENHSCPCARDKGYVCCTSTNLCVLADAGFCPPPDAGDAQPAPDVPTDAPVDAPPADVAADVPGDVPGADRVDVPPMVCGDPDHHIASDLRCHPILFRDDFEDGVPSAAWRLWRKTFVESGGRMNVGDQPRPGFSYGDDGDGRNAVLATHAGDTTWTDYRIDMDIEARAPGSFNPYNLPACTRWFSVEFRLESAAESWSEPPGVTAYSVGVHIPPCAGSAAQTVGMGSVHGYYLMGARGKDRGLATGKSDALVDGQNHYAIEIRGNNVKVFVNDQVAPVIDFTDGPPFPDGTAPITFGGFQISWALESLGHVDNVVVTDLTK
jgi:hypothetical protein